jgi:hypothetical protein
MDSVVIDRSFKFENINSYIINLINHAQTHLSPY